MTVFVERGSLQSRLTDYWQQSTPHELDDTSSGLCLLEGQIARTNLQRSLVSQAVPPR